MELLTSTEFLVVGLVSAASVSLWQCVDLWLNTQDRTGARWILRPLGVVYLLIAGWSLYQAVLLGQGSILPLLGVKWGLGFSALLFMPTAIALTDLLDYGMSLDDPLEWREERVWPIYFVLFRRPILTEMLVSAVGVTALVLSSPIALMKPVP